MKTVKKQGSGICININYCATIYYTSHAWSNFLCGCVGAYEYNRTSLLGRPKMEINFFFWVPRWLAWFVIHTATTVLVNILSQKRKDDCTGIASQVTILYMKINVSLKNMKNLPSHVSLILFSHVSLNSTGLYLIVMIMIVMINFIKTKTWH